jgi:hypothetical protein
MKKFLMILGVLSLFMIGAAQADESLGPITGFSKSASGDLMTKMTVSYGRIKKTVTLKNVDRFGAKERKTPAPKGHFATAFLDPILAEDRQTLGWLVGYKDFSCAKDYPCPVDLVLYKDGRMTKILDTNVIWGWKFLKDGAEVVLATGAAKGGIVGYTLYDVNSGDVIDKAAGYDFDDNARIEQDDLPDWAQGFLQ